MHRMLDRRRLLKAGVATLALLPKSASAAFWKGQTYLPAVVPAGNGQGGGPNLFERNIFSPEMGAPASLRTTDKPATSMSDYYFVGGALTFGGRPYDLDTMGSWGAAIKASKGYRYFFIIAPNHYSFNWTWGFDTESVYIGFSNDPDIPPDPSTMVPIISSQGVQQTGAVANINAQVEADGTTFTVNSITDGIVALGYRPSGLTGSPYISAMLTGKGDVGTYTLSVNQGGAVAAANRILTLGGTQNFFAFYFPWFVYNPDENIGFLYIQAVVGSQGGNNNSSWNNGLWSTSDLDTFAFQGIAFTNSANPSTGFTSEQTVYRLSAGSWISFGSKDSTNGGVQGYWTSTDGRRFVYVADNNSTIGGSTYTISWSPRFTIGAQDYVIGFEDSRSSPLWSSGTTYSIGQKVCIATTTPAGPRSPSAPSGPRDQYYYEFPGYISLTNGNLNNNPLSSPANWAIDPDYGMFLAQIAINSNGSILSSPAPIRLSTVYNGVFPGPTYITAAYGYVENGIARGWVVHGFFPSLNGATLANYYENGGGTYNEYLDRYLVVVDATAALVAAPPNVKVKSSNGSNTLTWDDIIPGHTYRIKRGTSAGSITTSLGDVNNVSQFVDTTGTPGTFYYYNVITLNSGVEAGFRTVFTYTGSYDELTSKHITRALVNGADPTTINEVRIKNLIAMLVSQDLLQHTMLTRLAWMGVAKTGVVSRNFDVGTTRLPRMGDLTLWDSTAGASTTTYGATAVNGVAPGLIGPNTTSRGIYGLYGRAPNGGKWGRLNPFQRKSSITVISSYLKNGAVAFTPIAMNQFANGLVLSESAAGVVTFAIADSDPTRISATGPALTGANPHIIGGMYDYAVNEVSCWVEGVSGTPVAGTGLDLNKLSIYKQNASNQTAWPLVMGSAQSKFDANSYDVIGAYTLNDGHAKGTTHADLIFDTALTQAQWTAVVAWLRADAT